MEGPPRAGTDQAGRGHPGHPVQRSVPAHGTSARDEEYTRGIRSEDASGRSAVWHRVSPTTASINTSKEVPLIVWFRSPSGVPQRRVASQPAPLPDWMTAYTCQPCRVQTLPPRLFIPFAPSWRGRGACRAVSAVNKVMCGVVWAGLAGRWATTTRYSIANQWDQRVDWKKYCGILRGGSPSGNLLPSSQHVSYL